MTVEQEVLWRNGDCVRVPHPRAKVYNDYIMFRFSQSGVAKGKIVYMTFASNMVTPKSEMPKYIKDLLQEQFSAEREKEIIDYWKEELQL